MITKKELINIDNSKILDVFKTENVSSKIYKLNGSDLKTLMYLISEISRIDERCITLKSMFTFDGAQEYYYAFKEQQDKDLKDLKEILNRNEFISI